MTLEEFQKQYRECAEKDYAPLFASELEFIVSLDGCMMARYDGEIIPHLADCDWAKVLDGVIEWLKQTPEYRATYWERWRASQSLVP